MRFSSHVKNATSYNWHVRASSTLPDFRGLGHRQERICQTRATASGSVASVPEFEAVVLKNGLVDFYSVLQVDDNASEDEIKVAYRQMAKVCHPDSAGEAGHNICILLNEAYDTLMNAKARRAYNSQLEVALQDEDDGYTGEALSKWVPERRPKMAKNTDANESRAVFVDENSCIGCMNCVHTAPATFRMNPEYGRARVFAQWINTEEDLETAVLSCPVDCIHWVDRSELPALEHVCQKVQKRVNVAVMMTNGGRAGDVFDERDKFLKQRKKLEEKRKAAKNRASPMQEAARRRAAQDLQAKRSGFWGSFGDRLKESFMSAASGTVETDDYDNMRVGNRKRRVTWRDAQQNVPTSAGGGAGTMPRELALVPVMAKVEDY